MEKSFYLRISKYLSCLFKSDDKLSADQTHRRRFMNIKNIMMVIGAL